MSKSDNRRIYSSCNMDLPRSAHHDLWKISLTTPVSPSSNLDDNSPLPQPVPRNYLGGMWGAINEAIDVLLAGGCQAPGTSICKALSPTPIHESQMHVVKHIPLGSTWDHNDPYIEAIQWVLAGKESHNISITAEESERVIRTALSCVSSITTTPQHHHNRITDDNSLSADKKNSYLKSEQWDKRFHDLEQFHTEFGHCLVPHNWPPNKLLVHWVKRQRYQFRLHCRGQHSTLTKGRLQALQGIRFVWSSHEALWEEKLQELQEFAIRNGHCNVPTKHPCNPQLAIWVRSQRGQYKLSLLGRNKNKNKTQQPMGCMTEQRYRQLKAMRFDFTPREAKL
jgi:hypothetical protein